MNCLAIEQDDGILVVDCGAAFPEDDRGIDVFHPDFTWLFDNAERISGVFLTHGHEDHIGGLPYLLSKLSLPVWGPPHTLGLVRRRLAEHEFRSEDLDLRVAVAGERYQVGPFRVEPVRVAHSIVEASALSIETCAGRILHTGDFNFDPDPPDGEPTDEARLHELGREGIDLLLSDSTNSDVPERPGSERSVASVVERLTTEAKQRVVIALFASNVQRLITFGELALATGRRICLLGRSLETQFGIASQIGRVHWPSDLQVSGDQAKHVPRDKLLVLAGGTQAERNSALRRLSLGTHQHVSLEPGDTVILSSRVIPGNERPVNHMLNDLLRAGIVVHSRITQPGVHTSGHAGRSEQRRMIELLRPRCFVPVHGTLHHMRRHEELARSLGVKTTLVVESGTPVVVDAEGISADPAIVHGRVPIALGGEPIGPGSLQSRSELGRNGVAVVSVVVNWDGGLAAPPAVTTRGVPQVDEVPTALRAVSLEVARAAAGYRDGRGLAFEDFLRRAARRKLEDLSGTRPLIELSLVRLDA